MIWDRIDNLLLRIEAQRRVLDEQLAAPARWRGFLRRELRGRFAPLARARVGAAFDEFLRPPFSAMPLTLNLLQAAHDLAFGGFDFRQQPVVVRGGGHAVLYRPPAATRIGELSARALDRAADGREPAALAAARLHLELLLIHPFADGNGRAVRLLSGLLLIRAGYRSTLFTAVEQHFSQNPSGYSAAFHRLTAGGGQDQVSWLVAALEAMAQRSRLAFLHRTGELALAEGDLKSRQQLELQLARLAEEERDKISGGSGFDSPP